MKSKLFLFPVVLIICSLFVLAIPLFIEVSTPTGTIINSSVIIEYNWTTNNLENMTISWDGTNYSIYDDSTVLFMNFDNRSALGENDTHVADLSKYGNNGTVTNAIFNSTGGRYNGAFEFDGSSSYIDIGKDVGFTNGNFTILAWVFNIEEGGAKAIIGGSGSGYVELRINGDEKLELLKQAVFSMGSSTGTVPLNTWTHVGVTYNGTDFVFYIDGASSGGGTSVQTFNSRETRVGKSDDTFNDYFNGSLDNIMIFNRTFEVEEIEQLYSSGLTKHDSTNWNSLFNESIIVAGLNATNSTFDWDYYSCATNSTGSENCTSEKTITYTWTPTKGSVTSNFSTSVGIVNPYFYGTNDQYFHTFDDFGVGLDVSCDGNIDTASNFTFHNELYSASGMNHIRIWEFDINLISLSEGVYNQTKIKRLMDASEKAHARGDAITYVSLGTPTWLANTTTDWCLQSSSFYAGDWASCPPTNVTKFAIINDYIIGNLTQVIPGNKLNFITYNEPWHTGFFLNNISAFDNITQAIEFGKIHNASYNLIKANHPDVSVGWSMFTSLQTDILSNYMMSNYTNQTDFIGLHPYEGTSYFRTDGGWTLADNIDDLLADCATYGQDCSNILFDEWDITIKNELPDANYTMEVAFFYQYLLNNIPSESQAMKFKWSARHGYGCNTPETEFPKKFAMVNEVNNTADVDYNITKNFGNWCSSGSTIYTSDSESSDLITLSCQKENNFTTIIMNLGVESLNISIDTNSVLDSITNLETDEEFIGVGGVIDVGILDSYEIFFLGNFEQVVVVSTTFECSNIERGVFSLIVIVSALALVVFSFMFFISKKQLPIEKIPPKLIVMVFVGVIIGIVFIEAIANSIVDFCPI